MGPFHFLSTILSVGTDKHLLSCTANIEKSSVTSFPSESLPGNGDTAVRDTLAFVRKIEDFLTLRRKWTPNAQPLSVNEQRHSQLMSQSIALEEEYYTPALQATFRIYALPSTACT